MIDEALKPASQRRVKRHLRANCQEGSYKQKRLDPSAVGRKYTAFSLPEKMEQGAL